jgi:histidine decarboxylase
MWIEHSEYALTVRLRKANDDITFKYSLSGEELYVNDEKRPYSHIYIMDHVTQEVLDEFAEDLKAKDAFAKQGDVSAVVGRGRGFR